MADERGSGAQPGGSWSSRGVAQLVLIVVVICGGIYFARAPAPVALDESGPAPASAGPATVNVVRPVATTATLDVRTTGVVSLRSAVTLRSQAAGEVVFVAPALRSGGAFSAGEVLLRIDRTPFEIRLASAQAALREAQARLRKQELKGDAGARRFQRENPGAEVPPLARRVPHIARAQARVERAQNAVENAEFALTQTTIALPFDGRVRTTAVQIGQLVGPTAPLGQVFAHDAVQLQAQIAQGDLRGLEPVVGRKGRATTHGGRIFPVTVERVSAVVDPQSRQATLYMSSASGLRDSEGRPAPRPGTFVQLVIPGPPVEGVFVLPEAAEQSGGSIWLVEEGALAPFQPRTLGRTSAGWVVAAFDPQQGVVVGRLAQPRAGMPVNAVAASQ